jgi:hypothetical protein
MRDSVNISYENMRYCLDPEDGDRLYNACLYDIVSNCYPPRRISRTRGICIAFEEGVAVSSLDFHLRALILAFGAAVLGVLLHGVS